ncbi:MAG TPA: DUF488 domain-containing protein [Gammaproteobacteria bacterium]
MPQAKQPRIKLKRAYDEPARSDGKRVLVDRVWPRGVSKEDAALECWLKDVAPSAELRKWFGHDPARWETFRKRYEAELAANPEPFEQLVALARSGTITLVFGARDERHNNAVVLKDLLERRLSRSK